MDDQITCRICLEDELDRNDVIAPCSCSGGSKWVHRECLDMWRTTKQDRAFSRCTECLQDFRLIPIHEDDDEDAAKRRKWKYWLLMTRDLGGAFLMVQSVIIGVGLCVYLSDDHHKHLITQFHMLSHPKVFYYLAGFLLSSAIVGLLGVITICCSTEVSNVPPGSCACHDCRCLGCVCDGATCQGCTCEGCSGAGSAGACDVGSLGPFALIVLAGFAVIGAIIVVMAGVALVQTAMAHHASVLYKRGLAQEFVVADLDSPDLGLRRIRTTLARNEGGGGTSPRVEMSPMYRALDQHTDQSGQVSSTRDVPEPSAPIIVHAGGDGDPAGESEGVWSQEAIPSAPELTLVQRTELARNGLI
jgi:hypothetical protein